MNDRLFVLDTNVLIHDPNALYRFKEHDVYLPMTVIEELDATKQGTTEAARNARQVSRFLDEIIGEAVHEEIEAGLKLPNIENRGRFEAPSGRLFLDTNIETRGSADQAILERTLTLVDAHPGVQITLVSKDINLRIKARVSGVAAEDYYNDKTLDDVDLLYTGTRRVDDLEWLKHRTDDPHADGETSRIRVQKSRLGELFPNEGLLDPDGELVAIAREAEDASQIVEVPHDYQHSRLSVWGISARNSEQNFALNLLMDPNIDFVSLLGIAGSGKTLLALAAGLAQCMESKRYREIIMTRETISVGEDIGFLPGSEEEKMTPWMGALLDNLEVLADVKEGGSWGRAATADVLQDKIKIRSLSFMRGRTFLNRYIIIDEAQNLTANQMRTLITRAGPGSKIVALGNIAQIDTPYLSETTSGLTYVVDRFRRWPHSGHVTLMRGERSRLADFAATNL